MNQLYLYVALIGVGIVLFALTRSKKPAIPDGIHRPQQSIAVDHGLKETLDEFMNELERDNARLVDSFAKLQNDYKQKFSNQQQVIQDLQVRMSEMESMIVQQVSAVDRESERVIQTSEAPAPALGFAFNEKYAKVVELSNQGLTAEQIARSTDIGMGEIQLVLGLAKREDN